MSDPMGGLGGAGPVYVQSGRIRGSKKGSTTIGGSSCFPCEFSRQDSYGTSAAGGGRRNNLLRAEGSLSSTGCLRFNVPLLPLPGQQYSQQLPEKIKLKYDSLGLYTPRWSQAVRRQHSFSPSYNYARDVVALNDPTFMEGIITRENARRARREALGNSSFSSAGAPEYEPSFAPLLDIAKQMSTVPEDDENEEDESALTQTKRAASHTGLTHRGPPMEEDVFVPPPMSALTPPTDVDVPDFEPGSRSRARVAALQSLLGGDAIVERHGKEVPKASPWLSRAPDQDEEAVAQARNASPVRLLIPST